MPLTVFFYQKKATNIKISDFNSINILHGCEVKYMHLSIQFVYFKTRTHHFYTQNGVGSIPNFICLVDINEKVDKEHKLLK